MLHNPSTYYCMHPVPSKLAPTEIGELTLVVVKIICITMWYSPYDCSTLFHIAIYGLSMPYSHRSLFYYSSNDHGWPTHSTHPYAIHGSCVLPTRVPYTVGLCRPLRPGPGLPGLDQRGVAQEKWSCGGPRSCLTYGLLLLALLVIWSVCHPSVLGDVIQGPDLDQTWDHDFSPISRENCCFPLYTR